MRVQGEDGCRSGEGDQHLIFKICGTLQTEARSDSSCAPNVFLSCN